MTANQMLILSFIVFMWLVIVHTFEEIASGIMDLKLGHIQMSRSRYLLGATAISTINLTTLALIIFNFPAGYYLGLFTSAVIGVFQAVVHTIGFVRENRQARGLGAGFYSSIPLAAGGAIVFIQIIRLLTA